MNANASFAWGPLILVACFVLGSVTVLGLMAGLVVAASRQGRLSLSARRWIAGLLSGGVMVAGVLLALVFLKTEELRHLSAWPAILGTAVGVAIMAGLNRWAYSDWWAMRDGRRAGRDATATATASADETANGRRVTLLDALLTKEGLGIVLVGIASAVGFTYLLRGLPEGLLAGGVFGFFLLTIHTQQMRRRAALKAELRRELQAEAGRGRPPFHTPDPMPRAHRAPVSSGRRHWDESNPSSGASPLGHFARVVGWTAAVAGFFFAWLWCVSHYPRCTVDEATTAIYVGVGLFVLAVIADFVRSLVRHRKPGEPRRWYFLSPAGESFTGRLLIGGVLLGLCVTATVLLSNALGFDLNKLNQPPPVRYRPLLPVVAFGVVFVAIGIGVFAALRRSARAPKRRMTQQELDALVKSVPPLTPVQRKAVFWIFLLVMVSGVISLLEMMFSKMGVNLSSGALCFFIVSATVSMTFGVREWAFKRTPDAAVAGPLPVAPLLLTPDPTPAGGNCPTCGASIPAGSPQGLCPRCLMKRVMQSANATRVRPTRPIDPPPPSEVNEFFPHLEVLELVGAGGMGAVYKARQPNLDRIVALKIVQSPTGDDDPVFAERFAREARAMAKLDHPNIVTIHESGEAGGLPYLLMEFVDGITLREAMADKVLTTAEALAVIPQICDALDYAHKNGVVHRDIKPENILIDQTGRVKIADFGLAKLADTSGVSLTHTRQAMGTPHYMAPEQWEKPNAVDHRADIYALGVVLYELLTGELPLGRFDLPSAKGKGNTGMDQVVLRALAKEPGQRYQHASDLKNELSGLGNWWDGPTPRRGFCEFRSKQTFLGWPLVHTVRGRDPATGRLKVAKGWIAVSDGTAVGGIAVGGVTAVGGITVGGVFSVGLLAVGGAVSIGLLAIAGAALGILTAVGGVAISAFLAVGGVAIGTFAIGGAAVGLHTLGGTGNTPEFEKTLGQAFKDVFLSWLK